MILTSFGFARDQKAMIFDQKAVIYFRRPKTKNQKPMIFVIFGFWPKSKQWFFSAKNVWISNHGRGRRGWWLCAVAVDFATINGQSETFAHRWGCLRALPEAWGRSRVQFGPVPRLVSGTHTTTSCRAGMTSQEPRYDGIDWDFRKAILDVDPS